MRPKIKKIGLPTLSLQLHPLLHSLTQDDRFQLTQTPSLDAISVHHLQRLLDCHPIPVTRPTTTEHYQCLVQIPFIERLRTHPQRADLVVTLLIYDDDEIQNALTSFLLFEPALALSTQTFQTQNIHLRLRQFKAQAIPSPTKRALAALADCSPSAFR
ncbi:hypothetical protein [Vibrio alginolyticus]|uniref:hypothetical protein n=1 Tax=Vibrio alginolyticus TaxID=663 RepID=UPI001BD55814|nr:hypothetical protein [Vibrio alginolyticus]MBS9902375.1 hypothetical protein [Vibrio alginolyticus]